MKKGIFFLVIVLGLVSCNALKKLTQFRVNYSTNFNIGPTLVVSLPLDIITPEIQTNLSQDLANNNSNKDLIESVKLEEMKLSINSPSGQDFSFLKDIEIFISADGVAEQKLASKYDVPDNVGAELLMDISSIELKEYLKKDKITLRAKAITDKLISQNIDIKIANRFFVDAKILGL